MINTYNFNVFKRIILMVFISITIVVIFNLCTNNIYAEEIDNSDIILSQQESLNISTFLKEAENYSEDVFGDINFNTLLSSAIKGDIDNSFVLKIAIKIIGKETLDSIKVISSIILIIVIHGILKNISEGLEDTSISQITYYVQYILIVSLIMVNFTDVIEMIKTSINNLVGFSNTLIPLLFVLILSTGNVVSANVIQPILIFVITFSANFINGIILPITLISTCLSIVSKVSDKIQLDKLSSFLKSSVVWALGLVLTIFIGTLSLEGSLSSSIDGITSKTAKAAVSNFIPVVGKILSDSVDTVIGCSVILKNAIGLIGVIVIIGICIVPIIKLITLMATYYIGAALSQPIADKKIIDLLGQISDTYKILLAILCSLSIMIIIGVTLVIKISNSGLMYS